MSGVGGARGDGDPSPGLLANHRFINTSGIAPRAPVGAEHNHGPGGAWGNGMRWDEDMDVGTAQD